MAREELILTNGALGRQADGINASRKWIAGAPGFLTVCIGSIALTVVSSQVEDPTISEGLLTAAVAAPILYILWGALFHLWIMRRDDAHVRDIENAQHADLVEDDMKRVN